jgi:hypothetical protein
MKVICQEHSHSAQLSHLLKACFTNRTHSFFGWQGIRRLSHIRASLVAPSLQITALRVLRGSTFIKLTQFGLRNGQFRKAAAQADHHRAHHVDGRFF